MTELSTRFNFRDVEDKWIKHWIDHDLFHARPDPKHKPYTIVIPPPNVTGILHMGHALNNTLQDIIIRYKRMNGFAACWMPGTDHAGIATQNVVEKQLAKERKTRHDIGREELLKRLWAWKDQYGDTIINQLKKLGASCDWLRTRFTMDEEYSAAVQEVFIQLYEKGLIYRGEYIINWCPRCLTALSDEEAEHRETQGALYYFRYPLKNNPKEHILIATTRPETMLGDTAVAVNPKDERYQKYIGKTLILPIMNREIPVITDDFVDPSFGTGAVKVTPAHDPNDFLMGQRHKLQAICVMAENATMNDKAGDFAGQDRFEARKAIVEAMESLKLLNKVEQHTHSVGHCYRCHTVIEPYLSKQWFVKMKPLAEPALRVVQEGKVRFSPDRWTKVYTNWMENIRDWCISRQIWWGHRIPAWYCSGDDACQLKCREPIIAREKPAQCPHCGSKNLRQDDDVLDTWFSSWLWPFATFGWPAHNKKQEADLKYFYPGHALFTASEIIFFWVARMIMAGIEFMGDIPFADVYIHGTVRDTQGRKMSKSLGNAIDPLEIIKEYGADALRFSLIINSGQDLYISKDKFEIGRNFANKIWNASRLVLMNINLKDRKIDLSRDVDLKKLDLPSRWIISRFNTTLQEVSRAIESFRYSEAESLTYEFFWNNYCDWYLEIIKDRFTDPGIQKVAFGILEQSIRMMNPFIPFVTEEIWAHLGVSKKCLAEESWPMAHTSLIYPDIEKDFALLTGLISAIRNTKAQWNIKPQEKIELLISPLNDRCRTVVHDNQNILERLGRLKSISLSKILPQRKDLAVGILDGAKFGIPLGDIIDLDKEKAKMQNQIETYKRDQQQLNQLLNNPSFTNKAPTEVVMKEKERLQALTVKIQELESVIAGLA